MWGERQGQNESTDSQNFRAPTLCLCLHEKECETGVVVEVAALTAHPTTQSYNLFIYKVRKRKENKTHSKKQKLNNCALLLPDQTAESDTFLILKVQSGCHLLGAFYYH